MEHLIHRFIYFPKWIRGYPPHNCLSHRKIVMVELKFDKKSLYKQKKNRDVMWVFGRNLPMTEKMNNLWFCFVALTCVFKPVPQLQILQSYYLWKLLCTALVLGIECQFSKNVKLFKKVLLRGKYETIKWSRYWVRHVICHPGYPYFYKMYMLHTNKNPKTK